MAPNESMTILVKPCCKYAKDTLLLMAANRLAQYIDMQDRRGKLVAALEQISVGITNILRPTKVEG
jgi:hypothetical protein